MSGYYGAGCRKREATIRRLQKKIECMDLALLSWEPVWDVIEAMSKVIHTKYPDDDPICKLWELTDSTECCECHKLWCWSDFDQFAVTCVLKNHRNDLQWCLDRELVEWNNILKAGEVLQQPWVIDMALESLSKLDGTTVYWRFKDIPTSEVVPTFATTTSDSVYAVLVKHGLTPVDPRRLYRGALKLLV